MSLEIISPPLPTITKAEHAAHVLNRIRAVVLRVRPELAADLAALVAYSHDSNNPMTDSEIIAACESYASRGEKWLYSPAELHYVRNGGELEQKKKAPRAIYYLPPVGPLYFGAQKRKRKT